MPDVGPGAVRRRAATAAAPAKPLGGANAAPDGSLVAPLEECSVCLNGFERPTIIPCNHWFCRRVQSSGNVPAALCSVVVFARLSGPEHTHNPSACKLMLPIGRILCIREGVSCLNQD